MTTKEKVIKVITVYSEHKLLKGEINPGLRFKEDLGFDSLDSVEVVMALEEVFNIGIPDEDMEELLTVGQVVEYVNRKIEGKNGSN